MAWGPLSVTHVVRTVPAVPAACTGERRGAYLLLTEKLHRMKRQPVCPAACFPLPCPLGTVLVQRHCCQLTSCVPMHAQGLLVLPLPAVLFSIDDEFNGFDNNSIIGH